MKLDAKKAVKWLEGECACDAAMKHIGRRLEAGRSPGQVWWELATGGTTGRAYAGWLLGRLGFRSSIGCVMCGPGCFIRYWEQKSGRFEREIIADFPWREVKRRFVELLQAGGSPR